MNLNFNFASTLMLPNSVRVEVVDEDYTQFTRDKMYCHLFTASDHYFDD